MDLLDYTFHPVYVNPYYGLLMNANFVRETEQVPKLFQGLRTIEKELDDFQLISMLRSTWRPAKVAAWLIGLNRKRNLEEELFNEIRKRPLYCEHLIFA